MAKTQTSLKPAVSGAVAAYEKNLDAHRGEAKSMHAALIDAERASGCTFGDDPVPTTLRPHFLRPAQLRAVRATAVTIINCLEKVAKFYFESPDARAYIILNEAERALIDIDPRLRRTVIKSRLDSFLSGTDMKLTEINCDSPAGMAYCDVQEALFKKIAPMKELRSRYTFSSPDRTLRLLSALLAAYKDFGGDGKPNIAVVDWREVRTQPEFHIIARKFESLGFRTVVVDPRDFDFHRGRLHAPDGTRIDLIYRRVITHELAEKEAECQALLDAAKKHKVCLANPFRSKVVANKSTLGLLRDKRFRGMFTPNEREIIARCIPWTHNFAPCRVNYHGRAYDILDLARKQRRSLVLKPADGYGGKGVCIGKTATAAAWDDAIHEALSNNWVLQELVPVPVESFPVPGPRGITYKKYYVNLNPFVFGGKFGGCISRLSLNPIINVSAGGAMVPTMTAKRKE